MRVWLMARRSTAGLAISARMTAQIQGLKMAAKNANDSNSLAQVADSAMDEVTNMLQRMRELAVQSANGTVNQSDRGSIDAEIQALKAKGSSKSPPNLGSRWHIGHTQLQRGFGR